MSDLAEVANKYDVPEYLYLRCQTCPLHGECLKRVTDIKVERDTFQGLRQLVAKGPCRKCGEEIVESIEGLNLQTVARRTEKYHEKNLKRRKSKKKVKKPPMVKKTKKDKTTKDPKGKTTKAPKASKDKSSKSKKSESAVRNKIWGEKPSGDEAMNGTDSMVAAVSGDMYTLDEFVKRHGQLVKAKLAPKRGQDWGISSLSWLVNNKEHVWRSKNDDDEDVFGAPTLTAPAPLGDRKKKVTEKKGKLTFHGMRLVKSKADLKK